MPNHVRGLFALAVLALPVMLAGCEWMRFAAAPVPPPAIEQPPPAQAPEAAPQRPNAPLPVRKPAQPAAIVTPPPAVETVPERAPVVVGLNRDMLIRQFGAPAAEREAPPARVLEFGNGECRLAAYLYFDTTRNDFYTLQYEVNGLPAPNAAVDRCLSRISRDASRR